MQRTGREYATCRRCRGSRYDPVAGTEYCARCNGTGQDPEHIAADVDALCIGIDAPRSRVIPLFQRGGFVPRREPQRARQVTPSNDISERTALWRGVRFVLVAVAVAFVLGVLAGRASAGEQRSYPTMLPETVRPSTAPAPGYQRVRTTWGAREYRVCTYTNKKLVCTVVCETPGGMAIEDVPGDPPPPVRMLVFLGGDCESDSRSEFYAVHRDSVDSRTFVGARKFAKGQPRVMELYPAHGEVVVMYRSAVLKGAQ